MPDKDSYLVVLGLGSNLGDSRRIVFDAIKKLERVLLELRCASLYETEPLYVTDQNRFINTAVAGYFDKQPENLLYCVKNIETIFGRNRLHERRWGERTLDIDILLFGNLVINKDELQIPHPKLKERRFALEPLLELLPEVSEPETGLFYRNVCQALSDQGVRRI